MKKALPQVFKERLRELAHQERLQVFHPRALLFERWPAFDKRIEDDVVQPWFALRGNDDAAVEQRRELLRKLHAIGNEALALVPRERTRKLSAFSGPVGVPASELRRGPDGVPALPAENATYLGKSLFTDYLLAVELGGILLLVAVVGAIVIAQRQDEQGKEIA